jgi:hypothetical protein
MEAVEPRHSGRAPLKRACEPVEFERNVKPRQVYTTLAQQCPAGVICYPPRPPVSPLTCECRWCRRIRRSRESPQLTFLG